MKKIELATMLVYEMVVDADTWEEAQSKVGDSISEDDWYLLDGLMSDYLLCTTVEESKPFLKDVENGLKEHLTEDAEVYFRQFAETLDLM